jgi:hypothetical protein
MFYAFNPDRLTVMTMFGLPPKHHKVKELFQNYRGKMLAAGEIAEIAKANGIPAANDVARYHGNPGKAGCPCCNIDAERIFLEVKRTLSCLKSRVSRGFNMCAVVVGTPENVAKISNGEGVLR